MKRLVFTVLILSAFGFIGTFTGIRIWMPSNTDKKITPKLMTDKAFATEEKLKAGMTDPQTGKKISSTIELVPDEIETVVNMYTWLVYERETLRGIERRLYAEQVLPRRTRQRLVKDFGEILPWDDIPDGYSKAWARSSVLRILKNENTGRWYYNRRITKRREMGNKMRQIILGERDKSEWICINVPAVISDELFEHRLGSLKILVEVWKPYVNNAYLGRSITLF